MSDQEYMKPEAILIHNNSRCTQSQVHLQCVDNSKRVLEVYHLIARQVSFPAPERSLA